MTERMLILFIAWGVLASLAIGDSDPLYCLSCRGTIAPRHCHTVEKCGPDQVCFTEKYRTVNNQELFNTGCRNPSFCNNSSSAGNPIDLIHREFHPHNAECRECCNSSVCNNNGCGMKGYPAQRGPLCFTCPQMTDPTQCETVDICREDEICHIHEEREFGDVFFSQSCQEKRGCLRQDTTHIFGKRSDLECTNCCNGDLCNTNCGSGTFHPIIKDPPAMDCWEIYQKGMRTSGVYTIHPWRDHRSKEVLCNMDLYPGGWTIIQTRHRENQVDFNKSWNEYKNGFGSVHTDYWIGNDIIHQLTAAHNNTLYIMIEDTSRKHYEEQYSRFYIADQHNNYTLTIDSANGTAGDSLRYSNGGGFYTSDKDNSDRCGQRNRAGWWYQYCAEGDLNIPFSGSGNFLDYPWLIKIKQASSLQSTTMLITRK